jgi:hypothetical protein
MYSLEVIDVHTNACAATLHILRYELRPAPRGTGLGCKRDVARGSYSVGTSGTSGTGGTATLSTTASPDPLSR